MRLELSLLDWIICCIVFIGSLAAGLWLSRLIKSGQNSSNFFLAGRRMTWPIIGASLFATNIGAEHVVGLASDAYRYGLSAGVNELGTLISLGIAGIVLYPYYLRNRVYTIPEFVELRYNTWARMLFSGLMIVICIMTKMAFTLFAGALVINSLFPQWDVMHVVWILGILSAVMTIIGGFATVAYTDTIQTVIMITGSALMTIIGLVKVGGWDALCVKVPSAMQALKPYDDPHYPFIGILLCAVYGGTFYWGMDQVNAQRVLGAPDLRQGRWGIMFAILLKLLPFFIFALPGVIALALFPGRDSRMTFVTLLNELLPTGLRGLLLASLLAALTSSLLAIMNSISTMAVRDFVVRLRPQTTEKQQVFLGRIAIVVALFFGVGGSYLVYKNQEGLYKYLLMVSVYLVMPIMPAIFFGILSKRVTLIGAAASVICGVGILIIFITDHVFQQTRGLQAAQNAFPILHTDLTYSFFYRGFWGTILTSVVIFGVSSITPKTSADKLAKTTFHWSYRIEPFEGWRDWRLQLTVLAIINILIFAWLW